MKSLKKAVFSFALVILFGAALSQTAFATCYISCAAICRYTCQFHLSGTCSDAQAFQKISSCCAAAFANTPGINDVPCTQGGEEN